MNKGATPTPAATPSELPGKPPKSPLKRKFQRLAIVIGAIVFAITTLATVLSTIDPAMLSQTLATFRGWPFPAQASGVAGALLITVAVAFWYPIRQNAIQEQQQDTIREGTIRALNDTITGNVQDIRNAIVDFLEQFLPTLATLVTRGRPADSVAGSGDLVLLPEPYKPVLVAPRPQDEVQLTLPSELIGRANELHWLEERLTSHRRERDTTVIIGIQGIGKTALASTAIDRIKNASDRATRSSENASDAAPNDAKPHGHFTGGIARVQCVGIHDPVEVVRLSLERVDPKRRLPPTLSLDMLRHISEELLAGKDILILLDGVEPDVPLGEVVRALRTEQRSAHILITTTAVPSINVAPVDSHLHLRALGQVHHEDGTVTDEALELFAYYAGKESAKEFGQYLGEAAAIVESLERHTYSLQLVGARVQVEPDILPQLATEIKRLNEGIVPPGIEGILKKVWVATTTTVDSLPDEARQLLFAFGAFGTAEAGRLATHALGEALALQDVDDAIHALVRRQLMESFHTATMPDESDCHRLRIHTLLHAYIATYVTTPQWADLFSQSKDAIAAHFARYIQQYDRYDPSRSIQRVLSPDANNIVHALDWAISRNQHEQVTDLVHGIRRFWHDRWLTDKSLIYMPTAILSANLLANQARNAKDAAQEKVYLERAADLAFTLGRVYRRVGRLSEAEPLFQQDLQFRRLQHRYADVAQALHQLAQLERSRGRMRTALGYCRQGLKVVRRHAPRRRKGSIQQINEFAQAKGLLLAQQGRIERSRGNLHRADSLFAQAFPLFEQTGDLLEQGVALGYRGRIARVLGRVEAARAFFEQSGHLAHQVYDFRGEGIISTQQGRIDRTRGDLDSAERRFQDGLNKAREVLDRQAEAVNLNYLGRIAAARGNTLEAEDYFKRASDISEQIHDRLDQGVNLGYLGRIALERGFLTEARRHFSDSLRILRDVEDLRGRGLIHAQVALVDLKSGHLVCAKWHIRKSLRFIRKVGDMRSEGTVLMYLGQIHIARRDATAARVCLNTARERAQHVQDRDGEAEVQLWLGRAAEICGEIEQAKLCYSICRTMVSEGGNKRLWEEADTRYNRLAR